MAILFQVIVDLLFVVTLVALWIQFRRPKSEDPRMTAGLVELQTKIAVLEDLGDRTEKQVQQLMTILENKVLEVQKKIDQADNMQGKISKSMEKSLEVVKIFQDKIPHEEIRERQNTIKFVKAALLANQGYSAREISEQVDLPHGELEFIIKVNKNELAFDQNQLPEWIQTELSNPQYSLKEEVQFLETPLQSTPKLKTGAGLTSADHQALLNLGEKFRQAQIMVTQKISPQNKILEPQQKIIKSEEQAGDGFERITTEVAIGSEDGAAARSTMTKVLEPVNWTPAFSVGASVNATVNANTIIHKLVEQKKKELNASLVSVATLKPESHILKRGKELGIRPVVFPRIEVEKR